MSIRTNIQDILKELPSHVKLIAVSKLQSEDAILEAYKSGQRIFGENRAQDLQKRFDKLPENIEWHFIGHLQTNKVKYLAPRVAMIHSIDSYRLLQEVDKEARKNGRQIDCLLQMFIAEEESKFGLDEDEALSLLNEPDLPALENIRIKGLMGMATFTDDLQQVRREFRTLRSYFDRFSTIKLPGNVKMEELSIGMSGDYKIAVEEGSTMVRIGSNIFGERNYE